MKIHRRGRSYRAIFDSVLRHVFLGLVTSSTRTSSTPQMIAMPRIPGGTPDAVDPARVLGEVMKALSDFEASSGVRLPIEAIEYVPNDSPYYEKYYTLAYNLALEISGPGTL